MASCETPLSATSPAWLIRRPANTSPHTTDPPYMMRMSLSLAGRRRQPTPQQRTHPMPGAASVLRPSRRPVSLEDTLRPGSSPACALMADCSSGCSAVPARHPPRTAAVPPPTGLPAATPGLPRSATPAQPATNVFPDRRPPAAGIPVHSGESHFADWGIARNRRCNTLDDLAKRNCVTTQG